MSAFLRHLIINILFLSLHRFKFNVLWQNYHQQVSDWYKNGEYPIYIVVCFKGRLEKSTGVSCLSRYWDAKREVENMVI